MSGDRYKGYACEHCLAHFVYSDSLDRHRSRCPGTERLRAEVAELKRRVRLARAVVEPLVDWEMGENSRGENGDPLRAALPLLDLRRPLPKKGRR